MEDLRNEHNHEECGCGHEHDHEECCCGHDHEEQFMTIVTDEDEELKCSVLGIFDVGDNEYIALLPVGDDEVLLYRYVENDGENFELLNIETDEEFSMVEEAFFDLFEEDAFEDEDDFEEE